MDDMKPCHIIGKFGKFFALVTCSDLNVDLNEKISK